MLQRHYVRSQPKDTRPTEATDETRMSPNDPTKRPREAALPNGSTKRRREKSVAKRRQPNLGPSVPFAARGSPC